MTSCDTNERPTILSVRKGAGVAGQFGVTAEVQYDDETPESITFVGSVYGGPVVMITPAGHQHFVTEPGRFGTFGEGWVRRFFGPRDAGSAIVGLLVALPFLAALAYVVGALISVVRATS